MLKKTTVIMLIIFSMVSFSACSSRVVQDANSAEDKVKVLVSFNPIREFAQAVGGDKAEVSTLIQGETEPHDFELKPRDFELLSQSSLFIYNGLGMEPWVDDAVNTVENKDLLVVDASKGTNTLKNQEDEAEKHEEEDQESHEHGEYDPHIWLSLKEAKTMTENIKNSLVQIDPDNKDYYEKNYSDYAEKLDELYNDYKVKFDGLKNKKFVTGHAAFGYLCRDFGLEQNSLEDVFAEGEPSAKKLKELVDYCRENNITTIFMEKLASPKTSETLANEVGAKVEKIYALEAREDNKDYIESMRDNLEKIYTSLKSME